MNEANKIQRTREGLPVVTEGVLDYFLDKCLSEARAVRSINPQLTRWIQDTDSENKMISCYIQTVSREFPGKYRNRVGFFLEGLYHLIKEQSNGIFP